MPQTSIVDEPAAAFGGKKVDGAPHYIQSRVNEHATAELPFGVMVAVGSSDEDNAALPLATVADVLAGVVVHSHAYNQDNELGDEGVKPDFMVGTMRAGVIWVAVEEAVSPGDSVYTRAVVSGAERAGDFRKSTDASDMIDCSGFASWLSTTTGAGLAQLRFDIDAA